MPSERERTAGWLRSQGLGLACGFATVLLLGTGSVVLVATRESTSKNVRLDDLTAFFDPPAFAHAWLYALFLVLALYAVNTALCTWDTVTTRWRQSIRSPGAFGPSVIHLSFLLALVAHLVGGLCGAEGAPAVIGAGWQPLSSGGEARLLHLEVDEATQRVLALVGRREGGGSVRVETLAPNSPLTKGLGADLLLLAEAGRTFGAVSLSSGPSQCTLTPGARCRLGTTELQLVSLDEGPRGAPVATISSGEDRHRLHPGQRATLGEASVQFDAAVIQPAVLVRQRSAPGHPVALAAAIVLATGLLMMGRRWFRPL